MIQAILAIVLTDMELQIFSEDILKPRPPDDSPKSYQAADAFAAMSPTFRGKTLATAKVKEKQLYAAPADGLRWSD